MVTGNPRKKGSHIAGPHLLAPGNVCDIQECRCVPASESWGLLVIANSQENNLTCLLETLKETYESQSVMISLIYGLISGTGLYDRYAG